MSYWGKLLGGAAGLLTGGPLGGALGVVLGHAADKGTLFDAPPEARGAAAAGVNLGRDPNGAALRIATRMAALAGRREQLFALVVVVLSAKLAKCDGPVSRKEIDAFKLAFRIPPESTREIGRLFDQARSRTDDAEPFARELARAFDSQRGALEDVMVALFAIARADGPVNATETAFLRRIHAAFGLAPQAWERAQSGTARGPASDEPDAYTVLGIRPGATTDEIRQTWRQLMRENHPDSLAARGESQASIAHAAERVGRINAAWDRIKRERGLK